MKRAHTAVAVGTLVTLSAFVRCVPAYEFGSGPGGSSDGGNDSTIGPHGDDGDDGDADGAAAEGGSINDAPADTRIDAPTSFAPTPVSILTTAVPTESGNAQQQHLVFATNSQRWWFFYIDADPTKLKAQWSIDFVNWTEDASLTLPLGHGGEGRDFSIAYKDIGGRDVVHAATSLHDAPVRQVWDTRATIAGPTITWEAPSLVHDYDDLDYTGGGLVEAGSEPDDGCDPDGVSVAIGASGRVYVATSWLTIPGNCYCDSNIATSLQDDEGTSWDAGFQSPLFHITVGGTTSARQLVALASGNMLAGWETADGVPPSDVSWDNTGAGVWNPEDDTDPNFFVFPQPNYGSVPPQAQEKNDWSFCRIDDNDIHAVHRKYPLLDSGAPSTQSRVFEHYRYNGAGWTFQGALADDVGIPGSGVALVTNGTSLLVATIAQDSTDSVRYATWNGTSWSAWASMVGPDGGAATRNYVSGTNCADPAHPAISWTEGAGAPYQVVAVPVAGLMP
jgi:hypothetical protein